MLSCILELCYHLIRSIDFLAHIFKSIPFKGITIEISALILGKAECAMSRAVTTRIVHYLKGRSAIPIYFFDNLPNLLINSRTTIARGNKIAAIALASQASHIPAAVVSVLSCIQFCGNMVCRDSSSVALPGTMLLKCCGLVEVLMNCLHNQMLREDDIRPITGRIQ